MTAIVAAVAWLCTRLAAVFLLAMVAIDTVDVGLRGLLNIPVFGSFDLIALCMAFVAFLVIPETFLRGEQITVQLVDNVVSATALKAVKLVALLATAAFMAVLAWLMVEPAMDYVNYNEVTIELGIPVIWKAAPVLAGFVIAVFAVLVLLVRELRSAAPDAPPTKDPV